MAWQHGEWMLLWGVLMIVVWAALIGMVALLVVTRPGPHVRPPAHPYWEKPAERPAPERPTTEESRKRLDAVR
jgi:hypothetical protein